jgi:hypothetical protein
MFYVTMFFELFRFRPWNSLQLRHCQLSLLLLTIPVRLHDVLVMVRHYSAQHFKIVLFRSTRLWFNMARAF